jgi:hypothetical protein
MMQNDSIVLIVFDIMISIYGINFFLIAERPIIQLKDTSISLDGGHLQYGSLKPSIQTLKFTKP